MYWIQSENQENAVIFRRKLNLFLGGILFNAVVFLKQTELKKKTNFIVCLNQWLNQYVLRPNHYDDNDCGCVIYPFINYYPASEYKLVTESGVVLEEEEIKDWPEAAWHVWKTGH